MLLAKFGGSPLKPAISLIPATVWFDSIMTTVDVIPRRVCSC